MENKNKVSSKIIEIETSIKLLEYLKRNNTIDDGMYNFCINKLLNKIEFENQNTFEGNAKEKLLCLLKNVNDDTLCLTDDSELSIDALDGFPGVLTARWSNLDNHTKNLELNKMLDKCKNRNATFTTVIAIGDKNLINIVRYDIRGKIVKKARGNNGFGFDEIFELENGKTLAELNIEEKNDISSRRHALEKIKDFIVNL